MGIEYFVIQKMVCEVMGFMKQFEKGFFKDDMLIICVEIECWRCTNENKAWVLLKRVFGNVKAFNYELMINI